MTTLEGRNVRLRPLTPGDAAITQKWRTSGRAFLLNKGAQSVDEQYLWIFSRGVLETEGHEANFIQELTATGQPVGMLSITDIHPVHRYCEVGHFLIGEPELVKPYGPGKIAAEACRLLYDFMFYTLDLRSFQGPVAEKNTGMLTFNRWLYREVGRFERHYFLNGAWQDAILFEMTKEMYEQSTRRKLTGLIGFDVEVPA